MHILKKSTNFEIQFKLLFTVNLYEQNIINQLNDDLRDIKQAELERKKSFIKDKFFSTQIYINRIKYE